MIGLVEKRSLSCYRTCDRVMGAGEGIEEGVSLGVDLDPPTRCERFTEQSPVLCEGIAVAPAHRCRQAGGTFDVGE
jgi:hypothetical protein